MNINFQAKSCAECYLYDNRFRFKDFKKGELIINVEEINSEDVVVFIHTVFFKIKYDFFDQPYWAWHKIESNANTLRLV